MGPTAHDTRYPRRDDAPAWSIGFRRTSLTDRRELIVSDAVRRTAVRTP